MRLVIDSVPAYHFWNDDSDLRRFMAGVARPRPRWMSWKWCRISDVLKLINREYNLKWKKRDLLTRFGIEPEQIRGTDYAVHKAALAIVMPGRMGPFTISSYRVDRMPQLEKAGVDFLVPEAWVKDVLWAMYSDCRMFRTLDNPPNYPCKRSVVACFEDGTGVYTV